MIPNLLRQSPQVGKASFAVAAAPAAPPGTGKPRVVPRITSVALHRESGGAGRRHGGTKAGEDLQLQPAAGCSWNGCSAPVLIGRRVGPHPFLSAALGGDTDVPADLSSCSSAKTERYGPVADCYFEIPVKKIPIGFVKNLRWM